MWFRSGVVLVQAGSVDVARRLVAAVGGIDAGLARIVLVRRVLAAVARIHLGIVVRMRMRRAAVAWIDARVLLFGHNSLSSQVAQDCLPQNPLGANNSSTSSVARLASSTRSSTVYRLRIIWARR